jgi:glycine dehydrogenase subunit 1
MRYIPNSPEERDEMLEIVGLSSAEELFRSIPQDVQLNRDLNITEPLAEPEVIAGMERLAANSGARKPSFLGAGAYSHYSPTIVDHLIQRSEFFTSYTPYQPEISQGTLQYIFEFQTLVCQLTGMEVANASMYDGSTSTAEAVLMAQRVTRRDKVLIAETVHPEYVEVTKTYTQHGDSTFHTVAFDKEAGRISTDDLTAKLDDKTACVVVQSPNFFGCIEDVKALADKAHSVGALMILVVTEAISLGLLKTPGECDVDIVVAEGQSFGIPLSFGGPYVGLFATKEKYVRNMPGRLCGVAYDKNGNRGFVLTLSTREQHIRREKATSNICTNQGLIALAATIYMEAMGKKGLQEVAAQNAQKAAYAARRISEVEGFSLPFSAPRFNEFVVRAPGNAEEILQRLNAEKEIIGGLALSRYYSENPNDFLVCVTETNTRAQIDNLVEALKEVSR